MNMVSNFSAFNAIPTENYQGEWIVVVEGEVVASGTATEIRKAMPRIRKEFPNKTPLLAKVPRKVLQVV